VGITVVFNTEGAEGTEEGKGTEGENKKKKKRIARGAFLS
jgi:hypothetical protein